MTESIPLGQTVLVKFGDLQDAPYNPRIMSAEKMTQLKQSLAEFGFVEPIVARAEDYLVIGGHQRKAAFHGLMLDRGVTEDLVKTFHVPVILLKGISDARAKALNLALNKISGEWDFDKLSDVLAYLQEDSDGLDIEVSGFTVPEISDLLGLSDPLAIDADVPKVDKESSQETETKGEAKKYTFTVTDPLDIEICNQALDMVEGNFVTLCRTASSRIE